MPSHQNQKLKSSLHHKLLQSMAPTQHFSSLICELKIIEARNIQSNSKATSLLDSISLQAFTITTRHQLGSTPEKSPKTTTRLERILLVSVLWNWEPHRHHQAEPRKLGFELWLRKKVPVFGASKLSGKGEILLKDVFESPNMVFDEWVSLVLTRGHPVDGVHKSTKLKVEMRVGFLKEEEKRGLEY